MHPECRAFVEAAVQRCGLQDWIGMSVLEFGALNINGGVRDLFSGARYVGVDLVEGSGVDEVGNAKEWRPERESDRFFDVALCLEVFEHTPEWPSIIRNMRRLLKPESMCIVTAASDPRAPHSSVDGETLRCGEYYANVSPEELKRVLRNCFAKYEITSLPRGDVQALAWT